MSGNHLNDLSKIYLDKVYKNNTETAEADKSRWEDLGGPTPDNYRSDDNSAQIKTESKKDEGCSDWRHDLAEQDLIEIVDGPEDKVEKKVKEKKVTNKIVINPKLSEAIEEIGGEVLELTEVEEKEEPKEDPALKSKEKKASMLKKQVLIKKLQAVRTGAEDITASYEPDIEGVIEYFYEEGINEEGFDQLIEEIGLEEFVDFVEGGVVELNEERAARRASVRAPSYEKVKAKVDAADAAKKKAKKGEYATSYAKKETDVTVYDDDKPAAKKKAPAKKTVVKKAAPKPDPKPVAKKPVVRKATPAKKVQTQKKVVKSVAKVKKTQSPKRPSKSGLASRIGSAVKKGVERHQKAVGKAKEAYKTQRAKGKVPEKRAKEFGKGVKSGVKTAVKFAKDVKKVVGEEAVNEKISASGYARAKKYREDQAREKDRKEQEYFRQEAKTHKWDGEKWNKRENVSEEELLEKDLNAAERRALPNKDFVFPGKGEGPKGKQRGAYPIPDKKHARNALAMAAAHASPEKQAKVKAAVKKKFPDIEVSEAKVDTGSAEEKATARNKRNTPAGKDYKFDTSVFITRKPGESLDSARTRMRQKKHGEKRGVSESRDKALDIVRQSIIKKHGEGAIYDAKRDKPTEAQKKKNTADRQAMQDKKNKDFADRAKKAGYKSTQDYANVVARYGSEDNMKKGRGLGT